MAKQNNIAARVEALIRPTIEGLGLRLWDVRYEKEGPEWFLRVFIDRDEPLDTDTCEAASRAIDPILDAEDPIPESYYLEVGSPGLGRRLVRPEHFEACLGQKVEIHLFQKGADGCKQAAGALVAHSKDSVTLATEAGAREISLKDISFAKLCDDENLF